MAVAITKNPIYHAYLRSYEWRMKRVKIITRDNGRCRLCGSKTNLQIHHLTYKNIFKEKDKDLITLCVDCHKYVETLKESDWKKYNETIESISKHRKKKRKKMKKN